MSKQPQGIAPGVYYDLPNEEYHADPALSSTGLKMLLKSPLKYWNNSALNPRRTSQDKAAFKTGRAFHTMLLEPKKFNAEFTIKPNCKSSTVAGMIGAGDYRNMINAVKAINSDSSISGLIKGGHPEVSIFWCDEETGIMCRVRFDYLKPRINVDYKTTTDISMESVGYSIADYRYDVSCAMYREGRRAAGMLEDGHLGSVLLFQEKEEPNETLAVRLSDEIMQKGYADFRLGLHIYKQHIEEFGVAKWSRGAGGVKDFGVEYMPYKYKQ